MNGEKQDCAICAWRETCQKRFNISGKDVRCADYTLDMKLMKKGTEPVAEKQ